MADQPTSTAIRFKSACDRWYSVPIWISILFLLFAMTLVEPHQSLLSDAALARDRLRIRYDKYGFVQISPADREGFLQELVSRSDGLVRDGDRVVRSDSDHRL